MKKYNTPELNLLTVAKEDILNASINVSEIDMNDNIVGDDFALL